MANTKQAGFSLIEVLIASTILLMIVMMLGMLFQSTSQAWRTGQGRADRFRLVRGFFGALQRDVACAVDESQIPAAIRTKLGGQQKFTSSGLQFYTLSGGGFQDDNPGKPARCSPTYVTYSRASRTETRYLGDGSTEQIGSYSVVGNNTKGVEIEYKPYYSEGKKVGSPGTGIPLFLVVCVQFPAVSSGNSDSLNVGVEARSAGPDGAWGTSDDITTASQE